jgi:DNA-binding NarL/FixJ family response regulator
MATRTGDRGRRVKKTILIVDDHPVLRRGLVALIENEPDLAICGEAASCRAALEAVRMRQPDLVIIDLELEDGHGLDLLRELKAHHSEIPALVLSMHDEAVYAERCLRAGARGYLTKQELDGPVLAAVRSLLRGETHMSAKLQARLAAKFVEGKPLATDSPLDALSDRELQVFRLIGQGRSTRQIATQLGLSAKTIESHREHIKNKLSLESAAELVHRAMEWVETGRMR